MVELIEQWFDEIDQNLEKGLNLGKLNNIEKKIVDHSQEYLTNYKIKPSIRMIRKWNRKMGLKKELQSSAELFEKLSRVPKDGICLEVFINMLIGNFYTFHQTYQKKSNECNYANVEMPVKFLKFYVRKVR